MRPLSIRLKGFKGIKAGMGLDEVAIDLNNLAPGIIVFSAPNGSGKTTILDNLHPYRLMPYRAGNSYKPTAFSYYDHIYGEAEKELIFEVGGVKYRSLLLMDAGKKKSEAYLYWDNNGKWAAIRNVDGKLDAYDKAIEDLIGSPELFFTSIFRAQSAKSLSDYTKGDIKDLFVELLNIDNLKAIGEKARRIKQELQGRSETLLFERKRLTDIIALEDDARKRGENAMAEMDKARKEIERLTDETISIQEQINECDVFINMAKKAADQKDALLQEAKENSSKAAVYTEQKSHKAQEHKHRLLVLTDKRDKLRALIEVLPDLRAKAQSKADLEAKVEVIKVKVPIFEDQCDSLQTQIAAFAVAELAIKEREKTLQNIKNKRNMAIKEAETALFQAEKDAGKLDTVPCALDMASQCRFIKDAAMAKDQLPALREQLAARQTSDSSDTELLVEIEDLKISISQKSEVVARLEKAKEALGVFRNELTKVEASIKTVAQALEVLPRAELAEKEVPEVEKAIENENTNAQETEIELTEMIVDCETKYKYLTQKASEIKTGEEWTTKKAALSNKLFLAKEFILSHEAYRDTVSRTLGAIGEQMAQAERAKGELEAVAAKITYLNDEAGQWTILEKAFSNDGVIALELDDAGPQIAALATEILKEYGGRFSVRLETQAAKADGKGQKETFDILVLDGDTNEIKSIKRMSGGERTWIEDSLTKAISLYMKQASGRNFDTAYSDEKDGALDPLKKREFFAAKRKTMELGGYRNEFCITQTGELQAMADAIIKLEKGKVEVITQ